MFTTTNKVAKFTQIVFASLILTSPAAALGNDQNDVQPTSSKPVEVREYNPIDGMSYTLGSNRFVGYYQQEQGYCALTLMLFKATAEDGTPDMSASHVTTLIRPGEQSWIEHPEGEKLQLKCNVGARTVTISHFRPLDHFATSSK